MNSLASPLQTAAAVAAVIWPFALGLGAVLWARARAAERARQAADAAVEGHPRGLYRNIEGKLVPERLAQVIDALEEAQAMRAKAPRNTGSKGPERPAAAT